MKRTIGFSREGNCDQMERQIQIVELYSAQIGILVSRYFFEVAREFCKERSVDQA